MDSTPNDSGDCSAAVGAMRLENLCDCDMDEEDVVTIARGSSFDSVIGHIEDVFMDEAFQELQSKFMEKHWEEFDDNEENKLSYMVIFKEYTDIIEKYIEDYLVSSIPDFSMASFVQQLQQRKEELEGEVFEVLLTFSDFQAFKEMFLDYKAIKDGTVEDLGMHISVTSVL